MALELGAKDFVVKPGRPSEMKHIAAQLVARVRALGSVRHRTPAPWAATSEVSLPTHVEAVVLGASTGGPRAIRDIVARFRTPPRLPVLVVQHMPPRFTEAFADRLRKTSGFDVREGIDGELVLPGQIRIAPGGRHLIVTEADRPTGGLRIGLRDSRPEDRWVPGVDELFRSAVQALGARVLGIVLTGMGRDGYEGARLLAAAGAPLWTESPLTAAIDGMPLAAAQGHGQAVRLPLDELAAVLSRLLEQEAPT